MIDLNMSLLIQIVNFVALTLLLNLFLYRPIRKVISDRRQEIESSRERTEAVDRDVQDKLGLYEARLHDAKAEVNLHRGEVLKQARAEEAALLEKARSEAAATLTTIRNSIAQESADARNVLKKHAQELSGDICAKILGRSL